MENKASSPKYQSLIIEGVKYRTMLTKKYQKRKPYKAVDDKLITSFISGRITQLRVKTGKKIKSGEVLLVLEAMKMENTIVAPMDGVIKKIHVKRGDNVINNQLLVELD